MDFKPGVYTLTSNSGKLFVYTFKEGFLSAVAHDLLIDVTNFTVKLNITDASLDSSNVDAATQADSLRVICATKNRQRHPETLKEKDKADIDEAISKDVLHPNKYPTINFRSTSFLIKDGGFHIKGDLNLHGVTHPIEFDITITNGKDIRGKVAISQKDFGIKPYKALSGTLKVKNVVDAVSELNLS